MNARNYLGLSLLAASLVAACGSSAQESGESSTDNVTEVGNPNRCTPSEGSRCNEQNTMRQGVVPDNEVARFIGTFTLSLDEGIHKSPICELTLEVKSAFDNALGANRLTDRKYRLTKCGTGVEERGTYKILEDSFSHLGYIEFTSSQGDVKNYGLSTTASGDMQIQNWYFTEEELRKAEEQHRKPMQATFDGYTFLRTGDFWCADVSDCEGQYNGCFATSFSPKGGGKNAQCEKGPPWACTNKVCKGTASK